MIIILTHFLFLNIKLKIIINTWIIDHAPRHQNLEFQFYYQINKTFDFNLAP